MLAVLVMGASALAAEGPKGTVPHDTPDTYSAHAAQNGVGFGATLLTSSQVNKAFHTDVNHCCVVVEVAIYPQKDSVTDVSLNDFALRIAGQDIGAKPSTPKVVAWNSSRESDRLRPTLILDMEQELKEKALGEGMTNVPVSGYLYFSLPKVKNAKYQLEYRLKDNKVTLALN
jgi:hypothetical protein